MDKIIGTIARASSNSLIFPIEEQTYKTVPTGGVINPKHKLQTMIAPKWTGSIPILYARGAIIGTKINNAGTKSITQPTTNKKILIPNKISILEVDNSKT